MYSQTPLCLCLPHSWPPLPRIRLLLPARRRLPVQAGRRHGLCRPAAPTACVRPPWLAAFPLPTPPSPPTRPPPPCRPCSGGPPARCRSRQPTARRRCCTTPTSRCAPQLCLSHVQPCPSPCRSSCAATPCCRAVQGWQPCAPCQAARLRRRLRWARYRPAGQCRGCTEEASLALRPAAQQGELPRSVPGARPGALGTSRMHPAGPAVAGCAG